MKILYLYSELVGYQIPIFQEYTVKYNAEVHVVSWDKDKLKPYNPPRLINVTYYKRSQYTKETLLKLATDINPDIIYVSGWMDKDYLYVTKKMKKKLIPIVTAFDDVWIGSFRQRIGALIFPFVFKRYFSHAWVAGPYQFEFAKRLGFKNDEVIFDMLSANTIVFNQNSRPKKGVFQRKFLYVGNFREIKGIDVLLEAYRIYLEEHHGTWKLICVGNGDLENKLRKYKDVEILPFSSEQDLIEISKKAGVLIVPSRHDQWGVVVHEFASLGMPLLLSENVGARATFFIEGFNGLLFKNNSAIHLVEKMVQFSSYSDELLFEMGENSVQLSKRIDIRTSVANFMSILRR